MSTAPSQTPASASVPDDRGRFGDFGGRFVPETLTRALDQLADEYELAKKDPEFQRELDGLLKTFVGRPSPFYHAKRLSEASGGAQIWLKRVILCLEDEQAIVIEPRMTGLVLLSDPPGSEHLRLRLRLDGDRCDEMLFWDRRGLGTVRLLTAEQLQCDVRDRLGPDAMRITARQLRENLRHSRRLIKVALLDQAAVAGIGNLYAAEILFVAGVDPRTRCDKLSGPQWQRIQAGTQQVLGEAIAHEGSTLSDGTYRNAMNHEGNYQNYHRVYDRADLPCRRCPEGVIRRIVQAQRSTFFCPVCQRKSGRHASVAEIEVSP